MKTIAIIGAGNVGAHVASVAVNKNLPAEILLIDRNQEFETGQVLDLCDSLLFSPNARVFNGDLTDEKTRNADIFVITAGVSQKPGETRIDLLERNVEILRSIKTKLGKLRNEAIVIIVTNPVDILTKMAEDIFELPKGKVLGTGTLLDTSRLRWRLAKRFDQNIANVHGYVLGEHGDSEFVAWSTVDQVENISPEEQENLQEQVRNAAYEIIEGKGATYFGIGAATVEILSSIILNSRRVFPVSASLNGEYGIDGIALGVPVKIGAQGIEEIVEKPLSKEELVQLQASAEKLKTVLKNLQEK